MLRKRTADRPGSARRRRARRLVPLAAAAAVVVGLLAVAGGGPAAATGERAALTAPSLADFQLRPTTVPLRHRAAVLDGHLARTGVQALLADANRPAAYGSKCKATAGISPAHRFCFYQGDPTTKEWVPQGVTTVGDAQADGKWGSRQAILVSWYSKASKGVRVSFLNTKTHRYQHVLLVYPELNRQQQESYGPVQVHAGGIAWYGNYLYVADTERGIRVFDLRYIFDLTKGPGSLSGKYIGRHGSKFYGYGYRYLMPQVGAWIDALGAAGGGYHCAGHGAPKFSYLSVDRTGTDSLISGEYCNNDGQGRVARLPLNGSNGTLKSTGGRVRATAAYRLPSKQIQGATAVNGTWYLDRTNGGTKNGALITATAPGSRTGTLRIAKTRAAGIGPEDLSYWPQSKELWTVTEVSGKRMLYAVIR